MSSPSKPGLLRSFAIASLPHAMPAACRGRPHLNTPRQLEFVPSRQVLLLALLFRDHELQSGPGLVDRADLDVDETERQRRVAHGDVAEIGGNAGRLFWPRHPDHAGGRDRSAAIGELAGETCGPGCKQMHHVERRPQAWDDLRAVGKVADDFTIGFGRAADKNAKARLDAELLRN